MHYSYILSTALCLSSTIGLSHSSSALPPSQDPWYTAPDNLLSFPAGSIIRIRPDPLSIYDSIGANITSASYNILYRTTDGNDLPSFAVATLFIPTLFIPSLKIAGKSKGLLSYQIPYNSPTVDASPSWTLLTSLNSTFPDIVAALEQGWYVSATDFEGPNATFAAGVAEGHAVLDGLRAVTKSSSSPVSDAKGTDWKIGLWGYSGGSIASEFAAELRASYAPEIQIAGVAIGGLPTPVTAVLDSVNETPYAGLIVSGLWGYANAFPIVESYLLSRLTDEVKSSGNFTAGRNMNILEIFAVYADVDVFSYFVGGEDDIFSSPLLQYFWNTQGVMGVHGLPDMPMYIYKAVEDQLAPVEYTDSLVNRYCDESEAAVTRKEAGVRILYERNMIGGHVAEETNADASAVEFLKNALKGGLGASWPSGNGYGCVVRNVTVGNDTSPDCTSIPIDMSDRQAFMQDKLEPVTGSERPEDDISNADTNA
ncbi:lipase 1 precursor, putative [Talaromyces stipitatus ATCC 10500]|uniref:Lipase 1, putative n=1 Tax=Talaromyces stipitatus (strain ATCC 10500 / CBS 375.48 / QM 6759 / NRRL 1006) TaxID=441959 RepID=B8MJG9_TALSN|nr:lipase 1 precursor, putative [Talaromyces stipitatus ATCC 10500]EED15169.1 lipase 1 precursor, putative [Talaromyces stipitatus ATCC 10500]